MSAGGCNKMTNATKEGEDDYERRLIEYERRLLRDPLSWDQLKSIILSPDVNDLSKLARSVEQQRFYRKCRADRDSEWESFYDYLLHTKFGFGWEWGDDATTATTASTSDDSGAARQRRRKRSTPTFQEYSSRLERGGADGADARINLSPNDFPYYLDPGIEHYVLWKLGGDVTPRDIANAKLDLMKRDDAESRAADESEDELTFERVMTSDTEKFLVWFNPPHLKSLPGIDHAHIIFRSDSGSRL